MSDRQEFDLLETQSDRVFRSIISESADGIVAIDSQSRIVLFNKSAEAIFGWSSRDVLGKPLDILLPERFRAGHAAHLADFVGADIDARYMGSRDAHIVGRCADGSEIPLGATILRVQAEWGLLLVAIVRDISDRLDVQAELLRIANTDHLTGILNRRAFFNKADEEIRRARRYGTPFSLVLFDLDHFKETNDTYGHQAGDAVLCEFSRLTRSMLRESDILGRWGGEEFIALLPHTELHAALDVAERVRETLERRVVHSGYGSDIFVTISVGVASSRGRDSLDDILKRADRALYKSKASGRNRVSSD